MTGTERNIVDPAYALSKKSTQDLLDRLAWLEAREQKAEVRLGALRVKIEDVRRALLLKGIVDVPR